MDKIVGRIAEYAQALSFADLPPAVVQHCKRVVLDSLGVALAAFDAQPCRIAREIAGRANIADGARIVGTGQRTLPELAAFANSVMTRYLDGNDSFLGGGGHPSDTIPAIFAAADARGTSGQQIITSIALAYEIYHNFWKNSGARRKHFDNVFYVSVGAAVGAAKALGLDAAQTAHALSLAITPNVPLDATRYGLLSMWKGCAAGNAARNAVFAALLAKAGITGPEKPIEGGHGLHSWLGEFELGPFGGPNRPFGINDVTLKCFHAVAHALTPITAALELSKQVIAADIERVTLYTYQYAWQITGSEKEKWRPTTREAADHSLPYMVAAVLTHGYFGDELFEEERLRDPRTLQLIDRTEVKEDPELTHQFPEKVPCRIEILMKNGERKIAQTDYPRGHFRNPMSDEEVIAKFRHLSEPMLSKERMDKVIDAVWKLESASNLDPLFAPLTLKG